MDNKKIIMQAIFSVFVEHPEAGADFIDNVISITAASSVAQSVNIEPIVDAAINLGEAIVHEKNTLKKPARSQKSRGGANGPQKIKGRRAPNYFEQKKIETERSMSERIEAAYMGEHMNIQPEETPIEKKPLTSAEKRLYDYMVAHPDHTKPQIENALLISQANYYLLKSQLKKKGWIDGNGVVDNVEVVDQQ